MPDNARAIADRRLVALLLVVCACASGGPDRRDTASGFLRDYAGLREVRGARTSLVFIEPGARFSHYGRVILDPVTLWRADGPGRRDTPWAQLQHLADYLETGLRDQLGQVFELVDRPGHDTLRVRVAISEARRSWILRDVVSRRRPPAPSFDDRTELATGTRDFVDAAAIEVEVLDSVSDRRMLAAVDERAGRRSLRGSSDTWSDVHEALDYWADVLRTRLTALRAFDAGQERIGIPPPR